MLRSLAFLSRLLAIVLVGLSPVTAVAQTGNCAHFLYLPALHNDADGGGGPVVLIRGCASLTNVDFNGDGYEDLAVGVFLEDLSGKSNVGLVNILEGSTGGLFPANDDLWNLDKLNVDGTAEANDWFGEALGAGDFNRDGYTDLVVGIPRRSVGGQADVGEVLVLKGSLHGLNASSEQSFNQATPDVPGVEEAGDAFGSTLATGDFNADGFADLAIGVPEEAVLAATSAGAVNVLYGSATGLTATGSQLWSQDTAGVDGDPELGDRFGEALAAGDFDGNGYVDLAIGAPGDDATGVNSAGAVTILFGSSSGLAAQGMQIWSQESPGVEGAPELGDEFGSALAAGDFNGDGRDDLAVGVPDEDDGALTSSGAANVLYGSAAGLTAAGDQIWLQGQDNLDGVSEAQDRFGWSLTSADFNGDGRDDLAIGVPGESTALLAVGETIVIYGTPTGLSSANDNRWFQDNIGSTAEAADSFALSLTSGDYDGNGAADLVAGVPGEKISDQEDAGAFNVIYGTRSVGLTSTNARLWYQDSLNVGDDSEGSDQMGHAVR